MDDIKKFSQIILDAARGADTNPGSSDAAVNSFARSAFVDNVNKSVSGFGNLATQVGNQEKEAADAARRAEIQRLQDKMDPNKYRVAKDQENGGYSFYDPDGKKITVAQYSAITGLDPAKILANSDNPFDLQFVNDYNNTKDIVTAIQNGDTDTLNAFKSQNGNIANMTPEQLMRELVRKYPHIYGNGGYADSYRSNNRPLLQYNTGGTTASSSGGDNYGFNM